MDREGHGHGSADAEPGLCIAGVGQQRRKMDPRPPGNSGHGDGEIAGQEARRRGLTQGAQRTRVLVVGVYVANRLNNIDAIVETLSQGPSRCRAVQRWAALGGEPPTDRVAAATALKVSRDKPRFEILNELVGHEKLTEFDYVLMCDGDVLLPQRFLDRFLALQSAIGFGIAQPGLTPDSFVNHPIVEQQRGIVARETRYVDIGPVVSFHRTVYPLVFPFDMTSPMGFGYERVWASRLDKHGKTLGIIDAVPVDYALQESAPEYDRDEASRQRDSFLARQTDLSVDDPFRVLSVIGLSGTTGSSELTVQRTGKGKSDPRISVVIPTHNRASLLDSSLDSLSRQTLPAYDFEIIVVDDGSTDATADVCGTWSSRLPLVRLRIQQSGIAAAKNLGVFAASSPIVLFFDDDDIADEQLLAEHLNTHAHYPSEHVAVLGYTDWAPSLEISDVMRFVTDIGHYLFNYTHLVDGQRLDFTYFWGGRSSCKKSLLTRTGVFRQELEFGSEDIEAGFRISKLLVEGRLANDGLAVIFNRKAVQHMNRSVTYDEFCRRCEKQGKSQAQFSRLYPDSLVQEWCQTTDALARWRRIRSILPKQIARIHQIEAILKRRTDAENEQALVSELHGLYGWTFDAFKTSGIVEEMAADTPAAAEFAGARHAGGKGPAFARIRRRGPDPSSSLRSL